jgi:small nuclear ribonucleoprotein (snRNP)-like protein
MVWCIAEAQLYKIAVCSFRSIRLLLNYLTIKQNTQETTRKMGKVPKRKANPVQAKIGQRVSVVLGSGEVFTGRLLVAEPKDGSVALADAERERPTKKDSKKKIRTQEGFVVIRGFNIASITVKDSASPVGWTGHRDSLVAVKGGSASGGGAGEGKASAINYASMMRDAHRK